MVVFAQRDESRVIAPNCSWLGSEHSIQAYREEVTSLGVVPGEFESCGVFPLLCGSGLVPFLMGSLTILASVRLCLLARRGQITRCWPLRPLGER